MRDDFQATDVVGLSGHYVVTRKSKLLEVERACSRWLAERGLKTDAQLHAAKILRGREKWKATGGLKVAQNHRDKGGAR